MALALAACSAPVQREFGKADQDSITKLAQEFATAYNAKDAAKVATLFSGGAGLMPPNASTLHGTESIQEYFVRRFAQGASDLLIEPKDIAGSGAFGRARVHQRRLQFEVSARRRPRTARQGKFLWILRDFSGKWLLEYVIFSSDFPAAPSPSN